MSNDIDGWLEAAYEDRVSGDGPDLSPWVRWDESQEEDEDDWDEDES